MQKFYLRPSDWMIWNRHELLQFLISNQKQDIFITTENEGCDCRYVGLYALLDLFDFESVTIETSNLLECHPDYNIVTSPLAFNFFKGPKDPGHYSRYHIWNENKIFSVFYNRPLWHRIGLASYLYSHHRDVSVINFRSDPHDLDHRRLFEIDQLFINDPESARGFLQNYHCFPQQIDTIDTYGGGGPGDTIKHTDQLCRFYPDIMIDVVGETFVNGDTFFVTEKTVRPMLMKKPMITMAGRDQLLYLRQMGFKTFYEFWDEDYDGYEGKERYLRILDLISRLAKITKQELSDMYRSMSDILDHNHDLVINSKYKKEIEKIKDV